MFDGFFFALHAQLVSFQRNLNQAVQLMPDRPVFYFSQPSLWLAARVLLALWIAGFEQPLQKGQLVFQAVLLARFGVFILAQQVTDPILFYFANLLAEQLQLQNSLAQ